MSFENRFRKVLKERDFSPTGGDSLTRIELIMALEEEFEIELSNKDVDIILSTIKTNDIHDVVLKYG